MSAKTAKKKSQKKSAAKKSVKQESRKLYWRLGLFRNEHGRLATVYTNGAGVVVPSMRKRVHGKILFHKVYNGITYKEARARLLKESGLKDTRAASTKATSARKGGGKKAKPSKEVLQRAA